MIDGVVVRILADRILNKGLNPLKIEYLNLMMLLTQNIG